MSLPCSSLHTLISAIDQIEICSADFSFHHLPWNPSSPLVVRYYGLRWLMLFAPKELYLVFSRYIFIKVDPWSFWQTVKFHFCYILKVIWYMTKDVKLDNAINFICYWPIVLLSIPWSKPSIGNFAFLFNCTSVGRTSDSMMVPT